MRTTIAGRATSGVVTVALACTLVHCSDQSTGPHASGIALLSQPGADTANAVETTLLIVKLRDSSGATLSHAAALVASVAPASNPGGTPVPSVLTEPSTDTALYQFSQYSIDTSDAFGHLSLRVRYGPAAGVGRLAITVNGRGVTDTLRFTIGPGNPVRVSLLPSDTTMYVDATLHLRGAVVDQNGNVTSQTVTYSAGPTLTVSASGSLTASAYARSYVAANWNNSYAVESLSVVPKGRIAASTIYDGENHCIVANLDGSDFKTFSSTATDFNAGVSWAPDGVHFIYANNAAGGPHLHVADTAGNDSPLFGSSPFQAESWAHYSADGQWVYFSGATATTYWLYRVHPDGTGLTMLGTNPGNGFQQWKPSPSPDGTKLAFAWGYPSGASAVSVLDLATLTSSTWSVPGLTPRWSPTGSPIAIMPVYPNQQVTAVNPDGTNDHVISPPNEYYGTQEYEQAFDWSPDGQWLILRNDNKYQLEVVQVATGLELPLAWGFAVGGPAWHAP